VNDANALVAALAGAELEEAAASAVALLALAAGQDVEPAEGPDGRAHWPPTRTRGSSPMRS
jgi:hypothetical protein